MKGLAIGASDFADRRARPLLAALLVLYGAAELWLSRGTTLFIDEVSMFQGASLRPGALFAPFNEHLELARRLLYAVALPVFGAAGSFLAAKLVLIACVAGLATVLLSWLAPRVGAAAALILITLVVFFGSAWELNFVISGIGNVIALATGLAALLLLDRSAGRRVDAVACLLLCVAVVSFSTGLALAVGALVLVVIRERASTPAPNATIPGRRPLPFHRVWTALVPLGLYVVWLAWVRFYYVPHHGEIQHLTAHNVLLIPNMAAQQAASTAGALSGLNFDFESADAFRVFSTSSPYGGVLAAAAALALGWRLRARAGETASPLLWALLGTLVAYWSELAIGSGLGRTPSTVRYVYPAGTVALLIGATAAATSGPLRGRRLAVLAALVAFALLGNVARLREGTHFLRDFGTTMRAQLTAMEIAAPSEPRTFTASIGAPPFAPVTAEPYLRAVARRGSPAFSEAELAGSSEPLREDADRLLISALSIHIASPTNAITGRCLSGPVSSGRLSVRTPGVALTVPATTSVAAARYADAPTPIGTLSAGAAGVIRLPVDRSGRPWRLLLSPAPITLKVCALPPR